MRSKKEKIIFGIIVLICACLVSPVHADIWNQVVTQVNQDINEVQGDIKETRDFVRQDRNKLANKLAALRQTVAKEEEALQVLKTQFDELIQTGETLEQEIKEAEDDVQALEEVVRTIAKDTHEMLRESLITSENPSRLDPLGAMLEPNHFPGMTDIRNMADMLFYEMKASREIRKQTGTFVDSSGKPVSGEILRVGKFTAFYQQADTVGYLKADGQMQQLTAIPGNPSWSMEREISSYFSGKSQLLPVDISGGIIAEQINQHQGIKDWIESGGILVWPIILIGVAAIFLSLERLYVLGRIPPRTDNIMEQVRERVLKKDWQGCEETFNRYKKIPTCNVLKMGLKCINATRETLENAIEEAILKELPRLERFLTTLSVLAAVSPLLGLLGTVTGMIHTFQGITIFGTSDPRMMSGGISEALITTQLGLAVAIPIIMVHHFFDRRVEKIIGDMEEKGIALVTCVLGSEKK